MVKQSPALADRPRSVAAGDLISDGKRILLVGAGERMRRLRAALHAALQPASAAGYEPVQMRAARRFVLDLLEEPAKHIEHARRCVLSLPLSPPLPIPRRAPLTTPSLGTRQIGRAHV